MGISRITALRMGGDGVYVDAAGPAENGKFSGWIMARADRWDPLLNTEPIYDTVKDATAAMEKVLADVREYMDEELKGAKQPEENPSKPQCAQAGTEASPSLTP